MSGDAAEGGKVTELEKLKAEFIRDHLASELFRVGDRVSPTEEMKKALVFKHKIPKWGHVVGFSRDKTLILVNIDGQSSATAYHPKFWRRWRNCRPLP